MNFCLVQDRQGQDEKENALFVTCSMCRDSKSSFEITQYVCKTQGHFRRERGMGGELEFTNSWRAGIEVGVCRCKSCIIRVKVSSWVVKPRTHGHCVPLTLSLKAQLRRSPLVNCNLQLRKWKIILKLSPPDKNFIHFIRQQINFQSKIKNHTVRNLNFLSKNSTFISQIDRIRFLKKAKKVFKIDF